MMNGDANGTCGASDLWPPSMFINDVMCSWKLVMVYHHNANVHTTGRLLVVCEQVRVGITLFTSQQHCRINRLLLFVCD